MKALNDWSRILNIFSRKTVSSTLPYIDYTTHLSVPRMSRYYDIASEDAEKAVKYYRLNVELAQTFLPLLHLFEVSLRNVVYEAVAIELGDNDWILNATDVGGAFRGKAYKVQIGGQLKENKIVSDTKTIKRRLTNAGKTVTAGRVVSETTLGFWVDLFHSRYSPLLNNCPLNALPNRVAFYNLNVAFQELASIQAYRNRISHHDNLFILVNTAGLNTLSLAMPTNVRISIRKIMKFINPNLGKLLNEYDKTQATLMRIRKV